jgi:hypothetical protein
MKKEGGIPIIKASSGFIQCKPEKPFSSLETDLFFLTLGYAYDNLLTANKHRIHIDLLNQNFGFKGNNWDRYDKALKTLQTTFVTWNIYNYGKCESTESKSWERVPYLGRVGWDSGTKEFFYTYDKELAKQLYHPDFYSQISGYMIIKMLKKTATKMLYANCRLYAGCPYGTRQYDVDDLKKSIFQLYDNQYPDFKKFNNRALKPAINQINNFTDIYIEPQFIKERRTVKRIKFSIKQNPNYMQSLHKLIKVDAHKEEGGLISILVNKYGINKEKAVDMIKKYNEERILANINYVEGRPGKKGSVAGYIITAIEQNYASSGNGAGEQLYPDSISDCGKNGDEKKDLSVSVENLEKVVSEIKKQYLSYCASVMKSNLYKLDNDKLNDFLERFKVKHFVILDGLNKKHGILKMEMFEFLEFIFESKIKIRLYLFYIKTFPEIKKSITEFSYYINGLESYKKQCYRKLIKTDPDKCQLF